MIDGSLLHLLDVDLEGAIGRSVDELGLEDAPALLPLDAGEQYRFSFDMTVCIGCHSCEVACAEQNGSPVEALWRRVGELESGVFPDVHRHSLSMACNHCLEPTCLSGCPTNAYVKLDNGVVKHLADSCIGCQYCIWNCPYEVPVFNPDRRIVTKCDMCQPRLEAGELPACVLACPTEAIGVEKVDVAAWRADHSAADGPGLPPSSITLSTTRIILPVDLPADAAPVHAGAIRPADPHWPLIALTLLTQLAVGTVAATVALEAVARWQQALTGVRSHDVLAPGAVAAFVSGAVALAASVLHLGRPVHAWKSLRNLRHSWLSREVALFGAFAAVAMVYAVSWLVGLPTIAVGGTGVAIGLAGVYASGRLYLVPARPAWNSPRTLVAFFATCVASGPLLAALVLDRAALPVAWPRILYGVAGAGTMVQLAVYQHVAASVAARRDREVQAFGALLFGRFRGLLAARVMLGVGAVVLCIAAGLAQPGSSVAAVLVALAFTVTATGELAGRYLFYVTVVPMTAARSFFHGWS